MALVKFLDPKNDVAFRKIFGSPKNKGILMSFINDILEFKDEHKIKQVEFLSPIQNPEIASKKESIVDVLCEAKNGEQIIVEMQVAPTKGFEKRAQYYAAKAYSRQLNRGSDEDGQYYNLKEVIFIAISNCILFPDKKEYKSDHVILDKETYSHDLKDFSFTFIELPKFTKSKVSELQTIIEKWCFFFKHAKTTSPQDLKKLIGSDLVIQKAYDALNEFNWTEKELREYDAEKKRIMDNAAAYEYQYDKGRAEGKVEIVKKMLAKNFSIADISELTGLSHLEIKNIQN